MTEVPCPLCGIVVQVEAESSGCSFDLAQWSQACKTASFGSPLLCPFISAAIEARVVKRPEHDQR
jgi:hypothetical protein